MCVDITETQRKLLDSGKRIFLEKGFKSAPLRSIVKEAGFTLGAFYGYYPDKAALFAALVEPAAGDLIMQFKAAQNRHFDLIAEEKTSESHDLSTEYLNKFLEFIYDNYDAFKLVICCAGGTEYENYIQLLVDLEVTRTTEYHKQLIKHGKLKGTVSPEVHHMITGAYFNAVFETVTHDMPLEDAKEYVSQLAAFFNCGWSGLIEIL